MDKLIIRITKLILLLLLVIVVCLVLYHEIWFLEYYHWPPVSFVKVELERTKLINEIESYQNIDEFKGFLSRSSLLWEVSKDKKPSPKGRPPFNISEITIKNYSHLSVSGELNVVFFNNRLMGTLFYPSDVEKYIKAIEKYGIKFDNHQKAKLPPYTRVRLAIDYKERKYVDWSDIRLDKEVGLWIKRYS